MPRTARRSLGVRIAVVLAGLGAPACVLTTSLDGLSGGAPGGRRGDDAGDGRDAAGGGTTAPADAPDAISESIADGPVAPPRCDPAAPLGAPVRVAELSSTGEDTALRLSADELTAYFSSDRGGKWRLFAATRANAGDPFGAVAPLPGVSQINDDDLSPSVTADGLMLVYEHSAFPAGGRQIFRGTRASRAVPFGAIGPASALNTPEDEVSPFVLPDGSGLFFARSVAVDGGRRSSLAFSPRPGASGDFGAESNVDTTFDASTSSGHPVAAPGAFYFASDAAGPPGKLQIYERRPPSSAPKLLSSLTGPAATRDAPTWASADGCLLYLQSDRTGDMDLYVARRGK